MNCGHGLVHKIATIFSSESMLAAFGFVTPIITVALVLPKLTTLAVVMVDNSRRLWLCVVIMTWVLLAVFSGLGSEYPRILPGIVYGCIFAVYLFFSFLL